MLNTLWFGFFFLCPAVCSGIFYQQILLFLSSTKTKRRGESRQKPVRRCHHRRPSQVAAAAARAWVTRFHQWGWGLGEETLCSQLFPDKALVWLVVTNINYAVKYSLHVSVLHALLPPAAPLNTCWSSTQRKLNAFLNVCTAEISFGNVKKEICILKKKPFHWWNTSCQVSWCCFKREANITSCDGF